MLEEIKNLCHLGKTVGEISKELNVSYMKVWHIIRNNGLKINKEKLWYNDEDVAKIKEMIESGSSYKEVGRVFNQKDFNILGVAIKYGFNSPNKKPIKEEDKAKILEMNSLGITLFEMEKAIGVPDSTISTFLKGEGFESDRSKIIKLNKDLEKENKRYCGSCKRILFKRDFFNRICKECAQDHSRKRYKKFRGSASIEEIAKYRIKQSKGRAKLKGIPFSLSSEDFLEIFNKQEGLCFYTGNPLCCEGFDEDAISIDRLDSDGGYEKGNCVLTTRRVNIMKNDLSFLDFIKLCSSIADFNKTLLKEDPAAILK